MRKPDLRRRFASALLLLASTVAMLLYTPDAVAGSKNHQPQAYALLFGTVFDTQGKAVYGAKIKIRRLTEKKVRWETRSNHRGEFAVRLPAGHEDYMIAAQPLAGKGKSELEVHFDDDERKDVSLHLTD